jgi:chromate reductase
MLKIAAIVGSLRHNSINKKLYFALKQLQTANCQIELLALDAIPMFNQDLETSMPIAVTNIKQQIAAADGILLLTPEYNSAIPAVLKNIIDWGTRPAGQNVWRHKVTAIAGASPSINGTAAAQTQLRSLMATVGSILLSTPEVCLNANDTNIANILNQENTQQLLRDFMAAYLNWINKHKN